MSHRVKLTSEKKNVEEKTQKWTRENNERNRRLKNQKKAGF